MKAPTTRDIDKSCLQNKDGNTILRVLEWYGMLDCKQ